jgi:undecaprenyl-diphosphatase
MVRSSLAKRLLTVATAVFCAAVVILRTVSGVHYVSDIIGGALLASALVLIYVGVCCHFFVKYYKGSSIKTK